MLRIVMDSAGDMPPGWETAYDIQVIPINIHFGEEMYLQGIDLSNADFYQLADESGIIPKTSQPTPHQFIEFYNRIAQVGDTILSIHVTGKLSGTLASAQVAARELIDKFNIIPIDSLGGSASMGFMCRDARILDRAGETVDCIVEKMKHISNNVEIILTLNTLEYARMSGRVKAMQAAMASILNVKPIIILRDGVLELGDRVRTRSRSLDYVVDLMAEHIGKRLINAAVVHAEDLISGQMLMEKVRERLNYRDLIMTELSTGVAANLGPGTVGIVSVPIVV